MTFREAMQAMLDGKTVRRESWVEGGVKLSEDGNLVGIKKCVPNLSISECGTEGWELYEEPKTPREWTFWYHEGMNAFSTVNPGDTPEKWQQIKVMEVL